MGRIKTSLRCVTDINRTGSALFGGVGGIIRKNEVFVAYEQVTRSHRNLLFRRSLCFKALILNSNQILWHWGELEGETGIPRKRENWDVFYLTNMWSDLNETVLSRWSKHIEGSYVSDAPFSTRIGSGDIGGWRRETEILENTYSGRDRGWKLDGKNKHKIPRLRNWHNWNGSLLFWRSWGGV